LTISITIESAISPTYNRYLCMLLQACSTGAICSDSTHSSFVIASISCSEGQLQGMIKRWPTYRLHSEIQLIVFYEKNPNLKLCSNYIGCDRLSCYLCYSFIKHHGHFSVDGCHQALYSLWAVPDIMSSENEKRADRFRKALKELCNISLLGYQGSWELNPRTPMFLGPQYYWEIITGTLKFLGDYYWDPMSLGDCYSSYSSSNCSTTIGTKLGPCLPARIGEQGPCLEDGPVSGPKAAYQAAKHGSLRAHHWLLLKIVLQRFLRSVPWNKRKIQR
jgi:hypothetical protein